MALSSSFDSVLVRAKGVSLQPTCVRAHRAAQAHWYAEPCTPAAGWHYCMNLLAELFCTGISACRSCSVLPACCKVYHYSADICFEAEACGACSQA